jgi:hypothetical protein
MKQAKEHEIGNDENKKGRIRIPGLLKRFNDRTSLFWVFLILVDIGFQASRTFDMSSTRLNLLGEVNSFDQVMRISHFTCCRSSGTLLHARIRP